MRNFKRPTSIEIWLVLGLITAGAYITNIVKFVNMDFTVATVETVLRAVGIVLPPLGVVMGFV